MMNLGTTELIIILFVSVMIPMGIIIFIISYFRKNLKLKKEQNELLRKIAEKDTAQ
jgi:hypothetical protein